MGTRVTETDQKGRSSSSPVCASFSSSCSPPRGSKSQAASADAMES